jgi:hypothetical protein
MRMRFAIGVILLTLVASCTKRNPAYCDDHNQCAGGATCLPNNTCAMVDGNMPGIDANIMCTSSAMCMDPTNGVCDTASHQCRACTSSPECATRGDALGVCAAGTCVECTVSDDCPAAAPICDLTAHTCGLCTTDASCAGRTESMAIGVCDDDGTCPTPATTLVVDAAFTGDCTMSNGTPAMPYCDVQPAIDAVNASGKHKIHLRDGHYNGFSVSGGVTLSIFGGPGAIVDQGSGSGNRAAVSGAGTDVTMRGFQIAQASSGRGVFCQTGATCRLRQLEIAFNGTGVATANVPLLELSRSYLHDNSGGGLITTVTDLDVENDIVFHNGTGSSMMGGVKLGSEYSGGGTRVFQFNTVFLNSASVTAGGVECDANTRLGSSILYMNTPLEVTTPTCDVHVSAIDQAVVNAMNGNIATDPLLVSEDPFTPDFHLMPGSPCIDVGETTAPPMLDFFGQKRDSMPDVGADELGTP